MIQFCLQYITNQLIYLLVHFQTEDTLFLGRKQHCTNHELTYGKLALVLKTSDILALVFLLDPRVTLISPSFTFAPILFELIPVFAYMCNNLLCRGIVLAFVILE